MECRVARRINQRDNCNVHLMEGKEGDDDDVAPVATWNAGQSRQ
jgi:hypothetical protein